MAKKNRNWSVDILLWLQDVEILMFILVVKATNTKPLTLAFVFLFQIKNEFDLNKIPINTFRLE